MTKDISMLIDRYDPGPTQTLGKLYVLENGYKTIFTCDTLELPWQDNRVRKSHIPCGNYKVVKRTSARFKEHFHLINTSPRTLILIHAGNTYKDTLGCILVGNDLKGINNDNHLDVINSKKTLQELLKLMPEKFNLKITESWRE